MPVQFIINCAIVLTYSAMVYCSARYTQAYFSKSNLSDNVYEKASRDLSLVGCYNEKLYNSFYQYLYSLYAIAYNAGKYAEVTEDIKEWILNCVHDTDGLVLAAHDDVIKCIHERVMEATENDMDLDLKINKSWSPCCLPKTMLYTDYFDANQLVELAGRRLNWKLQNGLGENMT